MKLPGHPKVFWVVLAVALLERVAFFMLFDDGPSAEWPNEDVDEAAASVSLQSATKKTERKPLAFVDRPRQ